jgi:hypothetical protein
LHAVILFIQNWIQVYKFIDTFVCKYYDDHLMEEDTGWACNMHGGGKKWIQNFGWKVLRGGDHSEGLGMYGKDNIKIGLKEICGRVWTGFIWFRIGMGGWLL